MPILQDFISEAAANPRQKMDSDYSLFSTEWHPQDWLLIAHTLRYWGETEPDYPQVWYAHYLAQCIADYLEPPDQEIKKPRDTQWHHRDQYANTEISDR